MVRTILTGEGTQRSFTVESLQGPSGDWVLHASGRLDMLNHGSPDQNPACYDLGQLARDCSLHQYDHSHYNQQRDSHFQYGARWGSYVKGAFGGDSGLSRIELPAVYRSDLHQYAFHPAVMDVALVYMDSSITGGQAYAPFSYKNITIYGRVPGLVYSYIRYRGDGRHGKIMEFDLTVMDEQGRAVVEIEGYKMAAAGEQLRTADKLPGQGNQVLEHPQPRAEETSYHVAQVPAMDFMMQKPVLTKDQMNQSVGITPEEGITLLRRILSCSYPRVLVSTTDLSSRLAEDRRTGRIMDEALRHETGHEEGTGQAVLLQKEEVTSQLIGIWKRVLGHEAIRETDDFFELGGDSLKVLTVAEHVHQQLNVKIPVTVFFNSPTIGQLAQFITSEYSAASDYTGIVRTIRKDHYSLSSAQKRLYFQHVLAPGNMAYHIPEISLLEGDLEIDRLQNAFTTLISRHSMLRTSFRMVDGEPVQTVADQVSFSLEFARISGEELEQTARSFMQPFDLEKAPLMRVKIAQYEDQQYLWLLDIHHIIADNLSVTMLQHELFNIYNEVTDFPHSEGPDYFDYVHWHNSLLESGKYDVQLAYWLEQMTDRLPSLELPADYTRPDIPSYEGDTYTFELDENVTTLLKQSMKTDTTTLFMNMMALYGILLHKYTGQQDLIIGASLSGRNHADLQHMIGMFANVLPFRAILDADLSYRKLLESVKATSLELFEHQDVPFDMLVDHLHLKRTLSANPLFNVMLVLPDYKPAELELDGVKVQAYPFRNPTSKLDLTLWVYDLDSQIQMKWEYAADLFSRETIIGISRHLQEIARQVTQNPEMRVREIRLETAFATASPSTLLNDGNDFAF